jgi:hypothetical protein
MPWVVLAFVVGWFLSKQHEQNLVAENAAQAYRLAHPIEPSTLPPGVTPEDLGMLVPAPGGGDGAGNRLPPFLQKARRPLSL